MQKSQAHLSEGTWGRSSARPQHKTAARLQVTSSATKKCEKSHSENCHKTFSQPKEKDLGEELTLTRKQGGSWSPVLSFAHPLPSQGSQGSAHSAQELPNSETLRMADMLSLASKFIFGPMILTGEIGKKVLWLRSNYFDSFCS